MSAPCPTLLSCYTVLTSGSLKRCKFTHQQKAHFCEQHSFLQIGKQKSNYNPLQEAQEIVLSCNNLNCFDKRVL